MLPLVFFIIYLFTLGNMKGNSMNRTDTVSSSAVQKDAVIKRPKGQQFWKEEINRIKAKMQTMKKAMGHSTNLSPSPKKRKSSSSQDFLMVPHGHKSQSFIIDDTSGKVQESPIEERGCEDLLQKISASIRRSYQLNLKSATTKRSGKQMKFHMNTSKNVASTDEGDWCDPSCLSTIPASKNRNILNATSSLSVFDGAHTRRSPTKTTSSREEAQGSWKLFLEEAKNPEPVRPPYWRQIEEGRVSNGFIYGRQLGRGKFGQVFLAQHIDTACIVAIKRVSKAMLLEYGLVDRFIQQIRLHQSLNHPNIIKFYGFFEEAGYICLILEYLDGGTLFDHLNDVGGRMELKQTVTVLREVIDALCYLHQRKIAHRDIKPENIVISATGLAKLCDFGWSTTVFEPRSTFCGTLDYASPEIIERRGYDESVDVWCVGVLAYEMLLGMAPFESANRESIMHGIVNVNQLGIRYIETLPGEVQHFVESILQKDPTVRPKIYELMSLPLLEQQRKEKRCRKQTLV